MILRLAPLPDTLKGPADEVYRGRVPKRARFLEPGAATSLLILASKNPWLTMTDVYRSPDSSLAARKTKRGVQPPGFSAHNFGIAIDLDVGACLKAAKIRYPELVEEMRQAGWHCHRRDLDATAMESWHFNYLGGRSEDLLKQADLDAANTWAWPVEARIMELYGEQFKLTDLQVQEALAALRFYTGDLDGKFGALSHEALAAFQRAWGLAPDGAPGPRTNRVLAVVSAEIELVTVTA